ncbi:MAG: hypothetical protein LBJ78_03080 [Puniceicoccales bacterium]|nr:hypothetical protein [Puniceicoccales bacterium]
MIPSEILAIIESDRTDVIYPLIEEQLGHAGTKSEWDIILNRIQQIRDNLKIDVKIKFLGLPSWCLYTPHTQIVQEKERRVITFEIWYDLQLAQWSRPVLTIQHMLQAIANRDQTTLRTNVLPCLLPPYIMLSHEMLHMLLRLDYILAPSALSVQEKVADIQSTNLKLFNEFLDATYPQLVPLTQMKDFFELWGAGETQREELIVILGGVYGIKGEETLLGETRFLNEHYQDSKIISWTHFLFEMITNNEGVITNRRFLDNAFQLECIEKCLAAFSYLQ